MSDESGSELSRARRRSWTKMSRAESSAKTAATVPYGPSTQGVRRTPSVTGTVDWNTIAPATLPSAMTSLPSRVQIRLFAASGSSVASGARISATSSVLKPIACEKSSTNVAKKRAPRMMPPNEMTVCARTSQSGGEFFRRRIPARPRRRAKVSSSKASCSSSSSSMSTALRRGALAAPAQRERGDADEEHHQRSEHEGRAEDGADADLVGVRRVREEDRNHGNQRFRRGRTDRGEDAPGRALADPQLEAEPLDA